MDLFRFVLSFARLNVCDVRRLASTRGISLWNQANLPDFHEILQSRQKILWLKKKNFPSVKYVNFSLYEQSAAHTRTSQGNLKRFGPCLRLPESTTKSSTTAPGLPEKTSLRRRPSSWNQGLTVPWSPSVYISPLNQKKAPGWLVGFTLSDFSLWLEHGSWYQYTQF